MQLTTRIIVLAAAVLTTMSSRGQQGTGKAGGVYNDRHIYNGVYKGAYLKEVAFPIGGIGAGMFCL
ncbi:MAG TPA: hypothetical protein VHC50_06885, partial [Puia sp.]|nr:hypothetical protein [Puia sp.]